MLLTTLGPTLLENILTVKGTRSMSWARDVISTGDLTIWATQCHFILWLVFKYKDIIKVNQNLMFILEMIYMLHRLGQKKIQDKAYVINLDKYVNVWTHWFAIYVKSYVETYFDSFVVEYIPKEIKGDNIINVIIYRIQANDMWILDM